MGIFQSPVLPAEIQRLPDVEFRLPNSDLSSEVEPLGVARYFDRKLLFMHLRPAAGSSSFVFTFPVRGATRRITHNVNFNGLTELLEISPLPFVLKDVLRGFHRGIPTFYIGAAGLTLPEDDSISDGSTTVTELFFSVIFQDGVVLSPRSSIQLLLAAMAQDPTQSSFQDWADFGALYESDGNRILVLNDQKEPVGGIEVSTFPPLPNAVLPLISNSAGIIQLPEITAPFTLRLAPPIPPPATPSDDVSMLSLYERSSDGLGSFLDDGSALPVDQGIPIDENFQFGHLIVSNTKKWFARRIAGISPELARFRINSRLEPIIDGLPFFKRLTSDLVHCRAPGFGAHMAGWAFENFALTETPILDDAGDAPIVDNSLRGLARFIDSQGGGTRFLANRFYRIRDLQNVTDFTRLLIIATALATFPAMWLATYIYGKKGPTKYLMAASRLSILPVILSEFYLVASAKWLADNTLRDFLEQSEDFVAGIQSDQGSILFSPHPAEVVDNPAGMPQVAATIDFAPVWNQFGSYHQKIQVIRRSIADADGNTACAYIGGMDIHHSRVDDAGHHGRPTLEAFSEDADSSSGEVAADLELVRRENVNLNVPYHPFHDVHARVTGPAVRDVALTFEERYNHDLGSSSNAAGFNPKPPLFAVNELDVPDQPAKHVIQTGRTYFRAAAITLESGIRIPDPERRLPFAPFGERTTYDTLILGLRAASEYIYVEDQYFCPNDDPEQLGEAQTYLDVLCSKAVSCKRLVILVPGESDPLQIFGDARRLYAFNRIREAWGDRAFIGGLLRRPVLDSAIPSASEGRFYLDKEITASASMIEVSPKSRVPTQCPFWLWINGELMLAQSFDENPSPDTVRVHVLRGQSNVDPRWGAIARDHAAGSPVTLSALKSIYIHSKVCIVDDLWVMIGSTNINRRGFFHDGECSVFAVPQKLQAAPDNPARALRAELWAEHLGLFPSMGASLLGDALAAFDLFRRSWYAGNRAAPIEIFGLGTLTGSLLPTLGTALTNDIVPILWNDAADPTSHLDEFAYEGPLPSNAIG